MLLSFPPPDTREGHEEVDEAKLPEVQQWWKDNIIGDPEDYERAIIDEFATDGPPDILIVVEKLLTGFDEPRNAVLYIDKSLKQHNLIQAIARVNRLHEEKKYGLLIDYRGILKELDTAISEYQNLAERTQGGFDIDDIEGLYKQVSTEYKRLPSLHDNLLRIFSSVKNKSDLEQYRQILIPHFEEDESGVSVDTRQKVREDFYEALTEFGLCLKTALGSSSFFEDGSTGEDQIDVYKKDLKFFSSLRKIAKQDAQETIDFSSYEDQIRKLVDRHVMGEEVREAEGVYLVNELGLKDDPSEWSEEKLRNETDLIRSRLKKTIEQDLADDPYAQVYFSELLKQAIEEAEALFHHPFKQYALFKEFEGQVEKRAIADGPSELADNKHASAYFGVLRLALGDEEVCGSNTKIYIDTCLAIEQVILDAVAENSVNPQNIETAIRKNMLPLLFKLAGLDKAKKITEEILSITRIGLSRGEL